MLKHCDPALKFLKTKFGHDSLKEQAIKAFTQKDPKEATEETKEQPEDEKALADAAASRVDKVLEALEPKKKANPSSKFRTFMNTQKNDLKQMVLPGKDQAMVPGLSETVALPKNEPLIKVASQSEKSPKKINGDNEALKMDFVYTNSQ